MAFSLHDFVLKTVLGMVGREPEYKVREYALGWYSKSVLSDEDLAELDEAYVKYYEDQKNIDEVENQEVIEGE